MKVITPIGSVVDVDDSVYEANSDILRKYEEGGEVESAVITSKEETVSDSPNTSEVAPQEVEASEAQEEVIEESKTDENTEVIVEPTTEVTPENGNEEIIAQAKTKATKAPKTK